MNDGEGNHFIGQHVREAMPPVGVGRAARDFSGSVPPVPCRPPASPQDSIALSGPMGTVGRFAGRSSGARLALPT